MTQNAEYALRVCDSCAAPGMCRPDGDAYLCERCEADQYKAIVRTAGATGLSPLAVQAVIECYFAVLTEIQNDCSGATS